MRKGTEFFCFAVLILALAGVASAQQAFTTTIYFDYAYYLSNDGPVTSAAKDNFFAFRRAYFTYENKINDNLKFRFRYDADNTANITSVDFAKGSTKKDDKLRPFIKHLYFDYAGLIPNSSLKVGMTETLTFKPAEDRWGYRSVAKTLLDGYKDVTGVDIDATSADLGASLTGSLAKYVRYGLMVSNGSHYSHAENDKWKKLMAQVHLVPVAGLSLLGYVDYEKQSDTAEAFTWKGDTYFEMVKNLVIGAEYFVYRNDHHVTSTKERYDISGLSIFGRYQVILDKLSLFGRFDTYEPNNKTGDNKINLLIAGFDWAPVHKSMKIQPNVWIYDYENPAKKDDLIFNLTFFLSF
ncbi:MAG: hypothetical protein QHH14_02055 [Clostridiales bacterium]|nr:hypothetical protein [Clostridiales bacterium]